MVFLVGWILWGWSDAPSADHSWAAFGAWQIGVTGLVMLLYLDLSYKQFKSEGRLNTPEDLWQAVYEGASQRVRPITMTEITTFIALVPLLWAGGAGADTMRRLAVPMVGGVATGYFAILLVLPVLFYLVRRIEMSIAKTHTNAIETPVVADS